MAERNWSIKEETKSFTIWFSEEDSYGYFEHNELGDECGGGLWFKEKELIDYDGVFELPQEVIDWLRQKGFDPSWAED